MSQPTQPGTSTPTERHGPSWAELTIFGLVFAGIVFGVSMAAGMDGDQQQLFETIVLLVIVVPLVLFRKHRTGHFYLPRHERAIRAQQMGSTRWGLGWFAIDVLIAVVAGVVSGKLVLIPVLIVTFAVLQLIDSAQWRWWGRYLDRHSSGTTA